MFGEAAAETRIASRPDPQSSYLQAVTSLPSSEVSLAPDKQKSTSFSTRSSSSSGGGGPPSPQTGQQVLPTVSEDDAGEGDKALESHLAATRPPQTDPPIIDQSTSDRDAVACPSTVTITLNTTAGEAGSSSVGSTDIKPRVPPAHPPLMLQLPSLLPSPFQQVMSTVMPAAAEMRTDPGVGKAPLWFSSDGEPYLTGVKAFRTGVFRFKGNSDDVHMVYLVTEMLEERA